MSGFGFAPVHEYIEGYAAVYVSYEIADMCIAETNAEALQKANDLLCFYRKEYPAENITAGLMEQSEIRMYLAMTGEE